MGSRPPAQDNATCETCGKGFHVRPSVLAKGKGKYCSKECVQRVSGEAHPLFGRKISDGGAERVCPGCGIAFRHRRSVVVYCSVACHHRTNPRKPTAGLRSVAVNGYVRLTLSDGRRVYEHRWIWQQTHGPIPPGAMIHHINEQKTDNRLENLKLVLNQREHSDEHGGAMRTYPQRSMAKCHPDRPNRGRGLCMSCYMKDRRGTLDR